MTKPILYILWRDAVSEDDWTHVSDITSEVNIIESVGALVSESEDIVTIALNRDTTLENYSCIMHIPRECIVDMHEVKLAKD